MSKKDHKNALPIGYVIEGYKIEALLGHGGFGLTYLARDINLDMLVAMKEYLPQESAIREHDQFVSAKSSSDEELYLWGLKKFKAEAQTLAQFDHHNIVHVIRIFEKNNTAYLVMKYVQGQSLGEYLRINGYGLTEQQLQAIFLPILDGLRAVHNKGLLHCDIKPDNIYICADRSPLLLDFGSARFSMSNKSRSANLVVSEGYAPHELYSITGNQGAWTDIYSIAASIYFCMTGKVVPSALDRNTALLENESDIYQSIQSVCREKYSESFLSSIDGALSVRIKDRPQTVLDFQQKFISKVSSQQVGRQNKNNESPANKDKKQADFLANKTEKKGLIWYKKLFHKVQKVLIKLSIVLGILTACIVVAFFLIIAKKNSDLEDSKNRLITLECEQLAGSLNQKDIASVGLKLEEIDATKAIPACEKALQVESENAKFQSLLGRAYFAQKDYQRALKYFKVAAQQEYALAENNLAGLYAKGYAVPLDLDKALYWYKKAAEQGLDAAQTNMGIMFYNGQGVPKDLKQARDWFHKAAEQEDVKAQNILAVMYLNGEGGPKDEKKAFNLFSKAAEKGLVNAQFNLGWAYQNGKGVIKNVNKAFDSFNQAARQGHTRAQVNLGRAYQWGSGVAKNIKKAISWYEKAVIKEDANAQYLLAMLYLQGKGNNTRAYALLNKAAEQGQVSAQYSMGRKYENSNDFKQAAAWYDRAVKQNHALSQYRLGKFYYYGQGVTLDLKKGKMLITKAAKQKVSEATKFLNLLLILG